jgi:hypothetical protein
MFLGSKVRRVRRADNLTAIWADCLDNVGSWHISQPYRPPRPVTGIALLLLLHMKKIKFLSAWLLLEIVMQYCTKLLVCLLEDMINCLDGGSSSRSWCMSSSYHYILNFLFIGKFLPRGEEETVKGLAGWELASWDAHQPPCWPV